MRLILKCFKVSLFVFNTFYFLLGLGLLIGSSFVYLNPNQLNSLVKLEYGQSYANFILGVNGVGIFFILVGFVGCLGIIGERSWLILIYFLSLFIIFTLQFACSVFIYTQSSGSLKALSAAVLRVIRDEYGESGVHARALDYVQAELRCCGWHSPRDWFESNYVDPRYTLRGGGRGGGNVHANDLANLITVSPAYLYKIPHSCCANAYDLTCFLMNKFHEVGCERIVKYIYQTAELYVAWTLAFLNMFQLIILVLSLYVLCMVFYEQTPPIDKEEKFHDYDYDNEEDENEENDDEIDEEWSPCGLRKRRRLLTGFFSRLFPTKATKSGGGREQHHNRHRDRDQVYMTSYYL